ncbi:MAG: Hpt domain-containing protein, partial [Desulfobacterales bacterium]|nr:Hpt domain-containing protein [Desulfobacterales bacterium]
DDYISKPIKSEDILDILLKYGPESGFETIEDKKREEEARGEEARGEEARGGQARGEAPGDAEASENEETPVLNPSQLLDMGDHDEELILELIDEFMKDAPALLDILRNTVDSGDQNRIAIKAHKLNGLAANFGGERFLEMGLAIENAAREDVYDPGETDFSLLAAELEKLKQALVETDWGALCER